MVQSIGSVARRRTLAALVVCASMAGLCGRAEAVPTALPSVTNGDAYNCVFSNLVVVPSIDVLGPLGLGGGSTSGAFSLSGPATCVFADATAPGTSTTFNAQISSHGRFSGSCIAVQFTGDSSIGPTVISGGPEGSILGSGSELYDIEISETAGVIDIWKGLVESDGDAIQPAHVAGSLIAQALEGSGLGCIRGPAGAFILSGSLQMTT